MKYRKLHRPLSEKSGLSVEEKSAKNGLIQAVFDLYLHIVCNGRRLSSTNQRLQLSLFDHILMIIFNVMAWITPISRVLLRISVKCEGDRTSNIFIDICKKLFTLKIKMPKSSTLNPLFLLRYWPINTRTNCTLNDPAICACYCCDLRSINVLPSLILRCTLVKAIPLTIGAPPKNRP